MHVNKHKRVHTRVTRECNKVSNICVCFHTYIYINAFMIDMYAEAVSKITKYIYAFKKLLYIEYVIR